MQIELRIRNYIFVLSYLIFIFTAGLKYETGVDWLEYQKMYNDIPDFFKIFHEQYRVSLLDYTDIGYVFINSCVKSINGNIQYVFLIASIITSSCLYFSLNKYTSYKLTSVYLYFSLLFFVMDMSGIRQGIALNIFFLNLSNIFNRNLFKFLFLNIIAFLFHWSALFLFPLYFILNKYLSSRMSIFLYISFVMIFLLKVKWLSYLLEKSAMFFSSGTIASRLSFYTTNSVFSESRDVISSLIIISLFTILFILLLKNRKNLEKFPFFNVFFNLFIIQLFFFYCLFEFSQISERLRYYTILSSIILIPYLLVLIYDLKIRFISAFCVLLFGLYFSRGYVFGANYTIAYTPYQNYVIYKFFNIQSTGKERLHKHSNINNSE